VDTSPLETYPTESSPPESSPLETLRSSNRDLLAHTHLVQTVVDARHLFDPALPLGVFHPHDLVVGPVKVICDICYLLEQAIEGVADYPPRGIASVS
jgi:hypothetical protein